jgi:hypothetical protein
VGRLSGILNEYQAAALFDGFRTNRPVAAAPRENHGKAVAVVGGQRPEEQIDGGTLAAQLRQWRGGQ